MICDCVYIQEEHHVSEKGLTSAHKPPSVCAFVCLLPGRSTMTVTLRNVYYFLTSWLFREIPSTIINRSTFELLSQLG